MTNDTIDQDARVARAAVVRPQRHAAVCADLDAAPMPIMRTLRLGAHSRSAECKKYPARNERRRPIPTLRGGKHHHWTRWRESRLVSPGDGLPPRTARRPEWR